MSSARRESESETYISDLSAVDVPWNCATGVGLCCFRNLAECHWMQGILAMWMYECVTGCCKRTQQTTDVLLPVFFSVSSSACSSGWIYASSSINDGSGQVTKLIIAVFIQDVSCRSLALFRSFRQTTNPSLGPRRPRRRTRISQQPRRFST